MSSTLPNWAMLCFLTKAGNTAGNQSDCKKSEPSANGGDIKDSRCRESDPRFDPKKLCDSTQSSSRVLCHSGSFALPQSPWKHRPQKSCGVVATHRPPWPYIFHLKPPSIPPPKFLWALLRLLAFYIHSATHCQPWRLSRVTTRASATGAKDDIFGDRA